MVARVMIMAGGTGGHVFPALAVCEQLRERGVEVSWLGNVDGFEGAVVRKAGIPFESIRIQGLRGNGVMRWLKAPFVITRAVVQAAAAMRRIKPCVVLGMGGFVAGPGGIASRVLRVPLVIHEQNAVPGMTNRWLSKMANRVLQAFPESFAPSVDAETIGNPVRRAIQEVSAHPRAGHGDEINLLVVGGSLGAQALNERLPQALAALDKRDSIHVWHQTGKDKLEAASAAYRAAALDVRVVEFIDDMAAAYDWADIVVCRAGALTIAELTAVGLPALLVPYPYAVDDHQTRNAQGLAQAGAARVVQQSELSAERLATELSELLGDKKRLAEMGRKAKQLGWPESAVRVAEVCEAMCHEQ